MLFHFERIQGSVFFNHQIDFVPILISVEIQRRFNDSLEERDVVLTPSIIGDVGRAYLDASRYEDFASQVEEWEEVGELSEEEYQRYLADKRIPNMIDKGLSDIYWECCWEAVSEVAHKLLHEYLARNTHSGTESAK